MDFSNGLKLSPKLPSKGVLFSQYGPKGDYRLHVATYWIAYRLSLVPYPTVIYLCFFQNWRGLVVRV